MRARPCPLPYLLTTQRALRTLFWETFPREPRQKIRRAAGTKAQYARDTYLTWASWLDNLRRNGLISAQRAQRATPD